MVKLPYLNDSKKKIFSTEGKGQYNIEWHFHTENKAMEGSD